MEKFGYWQRRWHSRWEDALHEAQPVPNPNFDVPGLDGLSSFAVNEGGGGWAYFHSEFPGRPPGPLLPGCEAVSDEAALAALMDKLQRQRGK